MNYRDYMKKVEESLGRISAADRILEDLWFQVVMKELNELSRGCADELEKEIGRPWDKVTYKLRLHEAPPARLLALAIVIAPWIGWVMHQKHGSVGLLSSADCWRRMGEAYQYGVNLSVQGERP